MELPYRWNGTDGQVRVQVRVNDDPAAFGCPEIARGFPYCHATVEHPAIGYADVLGWVQLVDSTLRGSGFHLDYFEQLGPAPYPFALHGWSPTLFDAPHTDEPDDWDFLAHTFLCGLGGELHEFRHEVRAVLGFRWGFSRRGGEVESFGPTPLSSEDWDGHRDYLAEQYGEWGRFSPGFHRHPLRS
jgi:hypothetical protein